MFDTGCVGDVLPLVDESGELKPTNTTNTAAYAAVLDGTSLSYLTKYAMARPKTPTKTVVDIKLVQSSVRSIISHMGPIRNAAPKAAMAKRWMKAVVYSMPRVFPPRRPRYVRTPDHHPLRLGCSQPPRGMAVFHQLLVSLLQTRRPNGNECGRMVRLLKDL